MTDYPNEAIERIPVFSTMTEFAEWGIFLTSATLVHVGTSREQIRWTTMWAGAPAPASPSPDIVPLGYFDEYQLHLCLGDDLPPTLMARRGVEGDAYLSHNLGTGKPLKEQPLAIQEAYRRAFALGYGEFLGV